MPCEDCVGVNNCNKYKSLIEAAKQGRSAADITYDTVPCRRGWGCDQGEAYETPYIGE